MATPARQLSHVDRDDHEQFRQVYADSFDAVWRYFIRMGVSSADAQDLVQEVYLTAYRRLDSFDPSRSARAWVIGIAVRVGMHHWRDVQRKTPQDRASEVASAPNQLEVEQRYFVADALAKLSLERRQIIALHVLEQYSLTEVADILGLPVNTVYSRFRRARLELKSHIDRLDDNVTGDAAAKRHILSAVLAVAGTGTAVNANAAAAGAAGTSAAGIVVAKVATVAIVSAVVITGVVMTATEHRAVPVVAASPQPASLARVWQQPRGVTPQQPTLRRQPAQPHAPVPSVHPQPDVRPQRVRAKQPKRGQPTTARHAAPGARTGASPGTELTLIQRARRALANHNAQGALDALRSHRLRYPQGGLREEGHALRVRALALAGRSADARIEAIAFLEAFPSSRFRPLVKKIADR